jgi:hypothetical protein
MIILRLQKYKSCTKMRIFAGQIEHMDHLPLNDIPMLVSSINFLLRDEEFENLDQICYCYDVERDELDRILASGGYSYREAQNRII